MKYLKKYIRKNKNQQPVGVVVAMLNEENQISIGYAKHNSRDTYNKQLMMDIAFDRATKGISKNPPRSVYNDYVYMVERSKKYFKGCTIEPWTLSIYNKIVNKRNKKNV